MPELTVDEIMQKLIGEFRQTLRADLRRLQAIADREALTPPLYNIISTKAQFEEFYAYNQALTEADNLINTETATVKRNSKRIHSWLSENNFYTEQAFRIPFDDYTTVILRIIMVDGQPMLDHSLNPDSELYTP